jgi:cation diffusion facilitator CzcD-associated flavoprotein CzcO
MQAQGAQIPARRVAVIGAGLCGLAAARCLLEAGLEPVVFERTAELGGLWNFNEQWPGGGTVAYRSLRTNTAQLMTAFSDFPFPDDAPDYRWPLRGGGRGAAHRRDAIALGGTGSCWTA